jgi:hypothetical protein
MPGSSNPIRALRFGRREEGFRTEGLTEEFAKLGGLFQSLVEKISTGFGAATNGLMHFVQAADPVVFKQLSLATRDLAAVIGQIMRPIVIEVTRQIRALANAILSLSPHTKAVVAGFIAATVAAGVLAAATQVLSAIVNSATFGLSAAFGAVIGSLVAVGMAMAQTSSVSERLGKLFEPVRGALAFVANFFEDLVGVVAPEMEKLAGEVGGLLRDALGSLRPFVDETALAFKGFAYVLIELVRDLVKAAESLARAFGSDLISILLKVERTITRMVVGLGVILEKLRSDPKWILTGTIGDLLSLIDAKMQQIENEPAPKKGPPRDSTNAAPRAAQISSIEEFGKAAQKLAFGAGVEDKALQAQEKTAANTLKLVELLAGLKAVGGALGKGFEANNVPVPKPLDVGQNDPNAPGWLRGLREVAGALSGGVVWALTGGLDRLNEASARWSKEHPGGAPGGVPDPTKGAPGEWAGGAGAGGLGNVPPPVITREDRNRHFREQGELPQPAGGFGNVPRPEPAPQFDEAADARKDLERARASGDAGLAARIERQLAALNEKLDPVARMARESRR